MRDTSSPSCYESLIVVHLVSFILKGMNCLRALFVRPFLFFTQQVRFVSETRCYAQGRAGRGFRTGPAPAEFVNMDEPEVAFCGLFKFPACVELVIIVKGLRGLL